MGDTPDLARQEPEFEFGDGCSLSLEVADLFPQDDLPVFRWN